MDFKSDIAAVAGINSVPTILKVVTTLTGMRFAAVARVTDQRWVAMAVRDLLGFGLPVGGELPLETTICNEIRQHREPVLFGHASAHPIFSTHHTPKIYGLESYISVPIVRRSGEFFGTLCAIDSLPRDIDRMEIVESMQLFAEMISEQLDASDETVEVNKALLDANRMGSLRDQFMAVLGHDLRNPLGTMSMSTHALLYGETDPTRKKLLGAMRRACERMAELITNILDFARGELGSGLDVRMLPDPELKAALQQIVDELRISHPDIAFETDIQIDRAIFCDRQRLAQLFGNLLSNAITHGDHAQPIVIKAATVGSVLHLLVENSGPEIPPEKISRLFHPFTRGSSEGSGLGLGLYIAHQIAKAHGGTISVASQAGKTRFTFSTSAA